MSLKEDPKTKPDGEIFGPAFLIADSGVCFREQSRFG